ncbi:NIPSNAP family containing protein [Verrucomicrobia bacterium]|nr:NIPSNAP family containing protein [Verrucomicrobiota bacterium]
MKRRDFLKTSMAASALAGLSSAELGTAAESGGAASREYYELRAYRLKAGANHELLDAYLEKAAIPALNRFGVKRVGVFTETNPKDGAKVYVLIPYSNLDTMVAVTARLNADPECQKAGADYLGSPKDNPAFDRIDSWLLLAFAGLPKLELAPYSLEKKPRMFELRTYESFSELKALKKVEMFNSGEIQVMREVGLAPVFYGQALVGRDLPHLTYMTSAESEDLHKQHWDVFGKHPVWNKLKNAPEYADTVSKITQRFLVPTECSQI